MRKPCHVLIVSLGCPKNLVDTEIICGELAIAGFVLTNQPDMANITLINTCSFIADARAEADREIRRALRWKKKRHGRAVVVAGCLPQRDPLETRDKYPNVDLFLGLDDVPRAANLLTKLIHNELGDRVLPEPGLPTYIHDYDTPRLQLTPPNYAYIKIAEGCDHRCAFCKIPDIRGHQRSRSINSIVKECENLLAQGVKELNLIAQDTTRYGLERDDGANLQELIRQCDHFSGTYWLRLLYTHPKYFSNEILEALADATHVIPYVDIPLQHISNHILEAMSRRIGGPATRELMLRLRKRWPGVAVRTTFLVGYPGESEDDFKELLDFVEEYRFERLGVFTFSPEIGTPAATLRDDLVPAEIAAERRGQILELQQKISHQNNSQLIGQDLEVLVDHPEENGQFAGRTTGDAPEIDNLVHFRGPTDCMDRGIVTVKITAASAYDLQGKLA